MLKNTCPFETSFLTFIYETSNLKTIKVTITEIYCFYMYKVKEKTLNIYIISAENFVG